jgi:hypothetical protein
MQRFQVQMNELPARVSIFKSVTYSTYRLLITQVTCCHSVLGASTFGQFLGFGFFFLCFASVQNCETYPPARGINKQTLETKLPMHVAWASDFTKIGSISFINKGNSKQSVKWKIITR